MPDADTIALLEKGAFVSIEAACKIIYPNRDDGRSAQQMQLQKSSSSNPGISFAPVPMRYTPGQVVSAIVTRTIWITHHYTGPQREAFCAAMMAYAHKICGNPQLQWQLQPAADASCDPAQMTRDSGQQQQQHRL